jgi:hypothetical protein
MRASLPTMLLSVAASLTWLGGSTVPAEAQAPGGCQYSNNLAYAGQGQCLGQDQGEQPADLFAGLCDPCDGGPRWIFAAEVVALQRSTTRNQPLFRDNFGSTSNVLVDSKFVEFPVPLGPKLSAICRGACGWDLEVAYFQMDGFDARASVPGTSFLVTDVNGANFIVENAQARYTSALYNGELNVRHEYTDWLTLLAGFRMGQLNERYSALGAGGNVPNTQVSLNANTFNHLYGFQLGADVKVFDLGGPWQINALCKAGIYDNVADQNIHQVDTDPTHPTDQPLSARTNRAAFLGEAGVVATYALTKRLAFRATAEAMWLTGVALAPEQIGTTNFAARTASVNTTGGVFYYGGGLGIECRF